MIKKLFLISIFVVGFGFSGVTHAFSPALITAQLQEKNFTSERFQARQEKIIQHLDRVKETFTNVANKINSHEKISSTSREKINKILNKRIDRLNQIRTILVTSNQPEDLRKALTELRFLIKTSREDFARFRQIKNQK